MCGSNALEDCTLLLVVGKPAVRLEQVARLARAYYHADPQVIDETSVRGDDGQVVVSLYADEVLYLPVTTEITSLP